MLVKNLRKLVITTPYRQIIFGVAFTNQVSIITAFSTANIFNHNKTLRLTLRLLDARKDYTLPDEFSIGLVSATWWNWDLHAHTSTQTNLVSHPIIEVCFFFFSCVPKFEFINQKIQQGKLSKADQINGVSEFMRKITQHRPRITCFVGLGMADIV